MNRLRNRLILVFLAATLVPLAATIWITTSLLDWSLNFSTTDELETLSRTLARTGQRLNRRERDDLKRRAESGEMSPQKFPASDRERWPESVRGFAESGAADSFVYGGNQGDRLDYLMRHGDDVWGYSTSLGGVAMEKLTAQIREAGGIVDAVRGRDLRRGVRFTYILLAASFWLVSLGALIYLAHRISHPIHKLTAGLSQLAAGDLNARVTPENEDEIGRAIQAFNSMAGRLQESTERLVYLRQLASWQTLARKMAHEVKNSLTPIRLTVEEMLARYDEADRVFMTQATQIVVDEIETLERRIRAFSQFAAEPPVTAAPVDVNSLLQERIAFLKTAHPEVAYDCRLSEAPSVMADADLVKGILTNLLENAAEAAGEGGRILGLTRTENGRVAIEVHDSGPGLSEQARSSLFQPTISFKKRGMGLGLSIARKSALLSGGDIVLVKGELGGAGFRVLLPVSPEQAKSAFAGDSGVTT
ncbi:MAG TPA: HAMP domain-containing sensor histidine kinase [Bryobacteraceae bacterium]|nr:HAMP domain-containing sensor histidine kinase [Bryobacteraceae bacterium]